MKFSIDYLKGITKDFLAGISILIWLLGLLLLVLIISVGVDINNKVNETENSISVSATGEVYAKPDLALTTFSVVTEAESVENAMSENTEKMNNVIDFVKSQGVQDKDLKTTAFNIYPRYEWCDGSSSVRPCPLSRRILVGYEVSQSLQVKIRDLDKTGEIIQGAAQNGVNQMGSLQFTVDNQDMLKAEARAKAIEEAKEKAKTLASQLGIRLVRISSFYESGQSPIYYMALEDAEAGGKGGGAQIETGENKISVTVNITYQIR